MLAEEFGSDTDDDDYVPTGEGADASEEEGSGEEEEENHEGKPPPPGSLKKRKKKQKKEPEKTFGRGGFGGGGPSGEGVSWEDQLKEDRKVKEEEKEKKKAEDIWAEFKTDVNTKSKAAAPSKPRTSLGDLFSTGPSASQPAKQVETKKPKSLMSSLFDTTSDKPHKDTKGEAIESKKPVESKPRNLLSSLFDEDAKKGESSAEERGESSRDKLDPSKVEITKVFDFAGEVVKVTKEVDADSSEAQKYLKKQSETEQKGTKRGGLASIVGSIGKKAKMGCLDKSKLDWDQFVAEEGIKEDLKTFNKGKDGFVEKQMFLERADLRQFEQEKAIREKTRKNLMK